MNKQHISIIIPCHNEEAGIAQVLKSFPTAKLRDAGYIADIIVIDNNSTDNTAKVAQQLGARVIKEQKKGKGKALKAGFQVISPSSEIVVMMDGDDTYKPEEIFRMIEPLQSGFCDVVVGSRLSGKLLKNALPAKRRLANWAFTFIVRHFYNANVTDVLSGYFAWKKEVIDELKEHLNADGFAIEMEMITKSVKLGYEVYSVPITYAERKGTSKVQNIQDGLKILSMFTSNLSWKPNSHQKRKQSKQPTKQRINTRPSS